METKTKKVITKKDHRCFGCFQIIPTGRKVEYFAGLCESDFTYGYVCEVCQIVLEDYDYDDNTWYEGELIQSKNEWESAARKFEERTGTSHNSAIMPLPKAATA
jgi:hypothetical protein